MSITKPGGIIVGKRVVFGQIVGSAITVAAFVWDTMNPESPLPAGVISAVTQFVTGVGQVYIANRHGVTQ